MDREETTVVVSSTLLDQVQRGSKPETTTTRSHAKPKIGATGRLAAKERSRFEIALGIYFKCCYLQEVGSRDRLPLVWHASCTTEIDCIRNAQLALAF